MTETVELKRDNLKNILEMFMDATELLEKIPELQDQGRLSESSQHIGAELEARVRQMNKAEKQDPVITSILQELDKENNNNMPENPVEELEKELL